MAWIQVDSGIREHDKIFNLADALGITDAHAVGLMVCLWTWAVTTAPDGDITNFPPRAIAKAAGWDKKPDVFIEAIRAPLSLFVESVNGRLILRNWDEREALLIDAVERGREQTKKRVQRYRERKQSNNVEISIKSNLCNADCNADVTLQDENVTRIPNQTKPYHTNNDYSLRAHARTREADAEEEISFSPQILNMPEEYQPDPEVIKRLTDMVNAEKTDCDDDEREDKPIPWSPELFEVAEEYQPNLKEIRERVRRANEDWRERQ